MWVGVGAVVRCEAVQIRAGTPLSLSQVRGASKRWSSTKATAAAMMAGGSPWRNQSSVICSTTCSLDQTFGSSHRPMASRSWWVCPLPASGTGNGTMPLRRQPQAIQQGTLLSLYDVRVATSSPCAAVRASPESSGRRCTPHWTWGHPHAPAVPSKTLMNASMSSLETILGRAMWRDCAMSGLGSP